MIRKILALVLMLTMVVACACADKQITGVDDAWRYRVAEDGYAYITGFGDPSCPEIIVPQSVGGLRVAGIDAGAFDGCEVSYIRIPGSVSALEDGALCGGTALCVAGYQGSAALDYAKRSGMKTDNLSALDFVGGVIDMTDAPFSDYRLSGSTLRMHALQARRLAVGSVVYLPAQSRTETAKAVQVRSIEWDGEWAVLGTGTPTVDQVYASISLRGANLRPDYSTVQPLQRGMAIRTPRGSASDSTDSEKIELECKVGDIKIVGTVSLLLNEISCDITTMPFAVQNFSYDLSTDAKLDVIYSGSASIGGEDGEYLDLLRVHFPPIGPMVITAVLRGRIDAEGSITVTFETEDIRSVGAYTSKGGWKNSNTFGTSSIELSAAAQIKPAVGFALTASLPLLKDFLDMYTNIIIPVNVESKFNVLYPESFGCADINVDAQHQFGMKIGADKKIMGTKVDLSLKFETDPKTFWEWDKHYCRGMFVDECLLNIIRIDFDTDGGEGIPSRYIPYGSALDPLPYPIKEGHEFKGWMYYRNGQSQYASNSTHFDGDTTLYAQWNELPGLAEMPQIDWPDTKWPENWVPSRFPRWTPDYLFAGERYEKVVHISGWHWEIEDNGNYVNVSEWDYPCIGCEGSGHEEFTSVTYSSDFIGTTGHSNCPNLSSVSFSSGMVDIGSYQYCRRLSSISLPASLKFLKDKAFYACSSLQTIAIPASCKTVGNNCFMYSGITSVDMAEGVEDIEHAFAYAFNLQSANIPGSVKAMSGAFAYCHDLSSVSIANGVESIGGRAFMECVDLSSITLPPSVTSIGLEAFENSGLSTISVEGKNVAIDDGAFRGTKLRSFSADVAEIGVNAFVNCANLDSVKLSGEEYTVSGGSFAGSPVKTMTLSGDNVTLYGSAGFDELESLTINADVIDVQISAPKLRTLILNGQNVTVNASGSINLETVSISGNVNLSYGAFARCAKLSSFAVNGTVTKFGIGVFAYTNLREIELHVDASIDQAFTDAVQLEKLTLTGNVNDIYSGAFRGCRSLKEVYLQCVSGKINNDAFEHAGALEVITIAEGEPELIFNSVACDSLRELTLPGGAVAPDWLFTGSNVGDTLEVVYCPNGSQAAAAADYSGIAHTPVGTELYTLTLVTGEGGEPQTHQRGAGNPMTHYTAIRPDYSFTGWFSDPDCTIPYESGVMPDADLTLYAGFVQHIDWNLLQGNYDWEEYAPGQWRQVSKLIRFDGPQADFDIPDQFEILYRGCISQTVRTVRIPAATSFIEDGAFAEAIYLEKIIVEEENEHFYVEDGALYSVEGKLVAYPPCRDTWTLNVPEGISEVAGLAFGGVKGCCYLPELNLPMTLKTVGEDAFLGLKDYAVATGPYASEIRDSIRESGAMFNPFNVVYYDGSVPVSALTVEAGELLPLLTLEDMDGLGFLGWSRSQGGAAINLNTFRMPASDFALYAVWGCRLTLPSAMKIIGEEAFAGGIFNQVDCPQGMQEIGARAFADCDALTLIRIPASVQKIADNAFAGCSDDLVIAAPQGSAAAEYADKHGFVWSEE